MADRPGGSTAVELREAFGVRLFTPPPAPKGLQLVGNTAEWIVESPVTGWLGPLSKFGLVYFDECVAGSGGESGGTVILGGDEYLVDMHDANGQNIARSSRVTDRLIKIRYTGPE